MYTYTKQIGAIMQNKPLTATEVEAMLTMLNAVADRLFLAGNNTLGNNIQEVIYCMEANAAEAEEA
jgi:hypothetical protein